MATNLLTNYTGSASYVSVPGESTVSVQVGSSDTQMLVEAVTVSIDRPVSNRFFLNSGRAALVGKGSCTVQIQGLFAKAEDIAAVFGTPSNPCAMEQTIKVNVSNLATCSNEKKSSGSPSTLMTIKGCIAQRLVIETSLSQDGALFQRATVTAVGHSAEVEGGSIDNNSGMALSGEARLARAASLG